MEPFSLDQSVGYTLNNVANLFKRELNDELQRAGIDVLAEQWALLYRLQEREGLNQQELAESVSRDNASVTRTLVALETKQLIERQQSDQDRRHRHLRLTQEGQDVLPQIVECAKRVLQRATQGITPEEVSLLNHLIQKMERNLST